MVNYNYLFIIKNPSFEKDEEIKNFIEKNLKKIRRDFSFPGVQFLIDIKREEKL